VTGWLSVTIDLLHAALMIALIAGLPLLFTKRWPTAARVYAWYSVLFVVLSQGSQWMLRECFLTTLARAASRRHGAADPEWFTVRIAQAVFGLAPDHRTISITFDVIVAVVAVGMLFRWHSLRMHARHPTPSA
jgi:hypothetical protein